MLDREVVGGSVVPLDPSAREAMGDEVRDHLLAMCRKSRIKVNPDRDLGTGHELLGYATAYDLLLGGGYTFDPADEGQIVDNLVEHLAPTAEDLGCSEYLERNRQLAAGASWAERQLTRAEETGSLPEMVRELIAQSRVVGA